MNLRQRFEEMVDRHYLDAWKYAAVMMSGSTETEDIVHQAFLLAFDRLAEGKEFTGDPGKWLRGTVRLLVLAWWRQKRKVPLELSEHLLTLADESEDAVTRAAQSETHAALEHCLDKLASEDRKLIRDRYTKDLNITRIAQELQSNVETLRVRLFRIRQALKVCVESRLAGEGA